MEPFDSNPNTQRRSKCKDLFFLFVIVLNVSIFADNDPEPQNEDEKIPSKGNNRKFKKTVPSPIGRIKLNRLGKRSMKAKIRKSIAKQSPILKPAISKP